MKLPSFRRLIKTDYNEEFQELVEKLGESINNGIETILQALNHNISLSDNILCTVKDIEVNTDATGKVKESVIIALSFDTPASGTQVIKVENLNNLSLYPLSQPFISFTQGTKKITINNITGLQANSNYRLKVVVYG